MEETEGKTGPCSDGRNCLSSLLFELKPKYSGGNKDNADFLQKISCMHCCTQCPGPAAGHCRHTAPLETPGHSEASLGQSFVGSLLLSPGSWCAQGSVCALHEYISQSCVSSGSSVVGLMATSSKRAYAIPKSAAPRALSLRQSTTNPYLHRRHSNIVLSQSVWGLSVLVCTRFV